MELICVVLAALCQCDFVHPCLSPMPEVHRARYASLVQCRTFYLIHKPLSDSIRSQSQLNLMINSCIHRRCFVDRALKLTRNVIRRNQSMTSDSQGVKYLTQEEAINLDGELFTEYAFSVDQLMELAGLGVATVIHKVYPPTNHAKPIICCGPGNNGGDGLVCARHLKLFGYSPTVIVPKPGQNKLYQSLLVQCTKFNIPVLDRVPTEPLENLGNLLVDSVFGFSFKPPNRNADLAKLLNMMHEFSDQVPLISVDIPSGWHVENGNKNIDEEQINVEPEMKLPNLSPDCLISLTAPKLCAKSFKGRYHYLAGRFCPQTIQAKYNLNLPQYCGSAGIVSLEQNH